MSDTCNSCDAGLTLLWCENKSCIRFVRPAGTDVGDFYLEHRERFLRGSTANDACRECRQPMASRRLSDPCPDCRKTRRDELLASLIQGDNRALAAEFDYFAVADLRTVTQDAGKVVGKKWQGYKLEVSGPVGRLTEWNDLLPEGMNTFLIGIPGEPDSYISLMRIRVFYEESPVYAETRRYPYEVRRIAIHGLERKHTKNDVEKALKGIELLNVISKKLGRKKGTRFYTESEFPIRAADAYRSLYDSTGEHPKDIELAPEMGISRTALYDHMRDYKLHMAEIRALAMKQ